MCVEDHISGCQMTAPPLSPYRNPAGTAAGRSAQPGIGIAHLDEATEAGLPVPCHGTQGRLVGHGESSVSLKLEVKAVPPRPMHCGVEANSVGRVRRRMAGPDCAEEDPIQLALASPAGLDGDRLRPNTANLNDTALGGVVRSNLNGQTGSADSKVGETPTWRELLDSPRYWYDSRIMSRRDDAPRDPLVSFWFFPLLCSILYLRTPGVYTSQHF